jgi:pimeloyl-ACP methyl ester carboxylesterase
MVRSGRVERDGFSLHYLEAGAGWPLVLLHAFPLSAEMWRPLLDRVPDGWRYIAPDLRGFGGSPPGDEPPTMGDYARDVGRLLDGLEIDRAAVGGLSMGGYVLFALLRQAPERVSTVVLADTRAAADSAEAREGRRKLSTLLRERGPGAVAAQMLPTLLSNPDGPAAELVRRLIESNPVVGIDHAISAMLHRPDSTPDLPRISVPSLVIVGEADAITPVAEARRMQEALNRSHFVVLPGAGHLSVLEAPDAFATALTNFLASNL